MKTVRDPIHRNIELDDLALELIDTPQIQRLRRIKQLGFSFLVYPGANHCRFEHSLGVYHLAKLVSDKLRLESREHLMAASLLHDVGHGPFSHTVEELGREHLGHRHEEVMETLLKSEVSDVLLDHSLDPGVVAGLIKGEGIMGQVLNSQLDVDRMDYLLRDSHYTGVAYGLIEPLRIIGEMRARGQILIVSQKGLPAAEQLLVSRYLMYPAVYYHHVSRIAASMFIKSFREMINDGRTTPGEVLAMDDYEAIAILKSSKGFSRDMIERILNRKLFKRALYIGIDSLEKRYEQDRQDDLENEIAGLSGIDPREVIVDFPRNPSAEESKTKVLYEEKIKPLIEVSRLVSTLEDAQRRYCNLGVYTPEEHLEKVKSAVLKVFDLEV